MRKFIGASLSLTTLFVTSLLSSGASAASPVSSTRAVATPVGRLQVQTSHFTQKNLGPKGYLKPDQIGGCCLLQGTVVRIENLDGKKISETPIDTFDTFTLSGLKPATAYNFIIVNPRYKAPIKLEKVMSGNWINFKSP
jgi:hypothetical protein